MKEYQRRFFFDQQGQLTAKFGISHTPAVVRASGRLLAIEEVMLPPARGGARREGVSS
jgi:conjugal transfer pilus assembly protein TraW